MVKALLLFSFVLLLSSCAKESIDPLWEVETVNQQRNDKPYVVTYPIQNYEVSRFADDIGDVPVVGGVFRRLAQVLADISIEEQDGTVVNIPAQIINIPELDEVDFDYIGKINLEAVHLTIREKLKGTNNSLNFIKNIQVHIRALPLADDPNEVGRMYSADNLSDSQINGDYLGNNDQIIRDLDRRRDGLGNETTEEEDEDNERILVLSYNKNTKSKIACEGTCLDLSVHDVDWKSILEHNRKFVVSVKFEIDRVPKGELELNGFIRMSVGLNTPF